MAVPTGPRALSLSLPWDSYSILGDPAPPSPAWLASASSSRSSGGPQLHTGQTLPALPAPALPEAVQSLTHLTPLPSSYPPRTPL